MAAEQRVRRMASLMRRELSTLFAEIADPAIRGLSVTDVRLSGDLGHARVYCSVPAGQSDDTAVQAGLERAGGYLRRQLASRVKMRSVPQLRFELDRSGEQGDELLRLIDDACSSSPGSTAEEL